MKVVVTGAAGFIGSHLAEKLNEMGHDVVGIDCFTNYYAPQLKQLNAADLAEQGIPIYKLDLAEDDLSVALEGAEFVYHLAAQPGISATTPYDVYIRNNLNATHRLLEATKTQPTLKLFVNTGTSSIYGKYATEPETMPPQPTSYYGVTKLAAEQLTLAYHRDQGFPACSLRIYSALGPRERPEKLYTKLIRAILLDEPFPLFEGSSEHSRSYSYVGDIVNGYISVLDQPEKAIGEIFNIGSDKEMTTGQGIAIVEEIMGKKAIFDMKPRRPGDQLRTCADISKAREVLGYEPQTSLAVALEEQVKWYNERIFAAGLQKFG